MYLCEHGAALSDTPLQQPTINVLVAFKDRLTITNADWPYVVEIMNLGPGATIHYLHCARQSINNQLHPQQVSASIFSYIINKMQTAGKCGHELNIKAMLEYLLLHNPPKDNSIPIQIKFSLDGGTVTSGKKIKQEQGTLQILTSHTLRELKSHNSAHQWLIYIGEEDHDILAEKLRHSLPDIISLIDGKVCSPLTDFAIYIRSNIDDC